MVICCAALVPFLPTSKPVAESDPMRNATLIKRTEADFIVLEAGSPLQTHSNEVSARSAACHANLLQLHIKHQ